MDGLFADGRVVDLILALVVLEALVLAAIYRATGRGLSFFDFSFNLLAGACLLLALRGALMGAARVWIALALIAALLAHLSDLYRRWR